MPENKHLCFFVMVLYALLILIVLWAVFRYLFWWFAPFLIAAALAALIERPVRFCKTRLHIPRALASGVLTLLSFAGLGSLLWMALSRILRELYAFLTHLPARTELLMGLARFLQRLSTHLPEAISSWLFSSFETLVRDGIQIPQGLLSRLGSFATSAAAQLPSILFFLLVALIATYFFSTDHERIHHALRAHLPPRWKRLFSDTRREVLRAFASYLRALALLLSLTFAELVVGLTVLRIPYALGLAFLIAFIDAVPVLGTGTVLVPWALARFLQGDFATGLGLLILYGIIVIVRNIIEPKLIGRQIGLHPLVTLISLYVGVRAFGALGILLPIPVALGLQLYRLGYFKTTKEKEKRPQAP